MTLAIAIHHHDSILMIADTVFTTPESTPKGQWTSFGQIQQLDHRAIEEKAIKLFPIGDDFMVSYSGSVAQAISFFNYLISHRGKVSPSELLESRFRSIMPNEYDNLDVLVAFRDGHGVRLRHWSSTQGLMPNRGILSYLIGSLPQYYKKELSKTVVECKLNNFDLDWTLQTITAEFQWYAAQNNLMEYGVGGAFFGGILGPSGFRWQRDTTYFLYHPDFYRVDNEHENRRNEINDWIRIVTCCGCGDALIVNNVTNEKQLKALFHLLPSNVSEWRMKVAEPVIDKASIMQTDVYSFISTGSSAVTITDKKEMFRITWRLENKELTFHPSDQFIECLLRPGRSDNFPDLFISGESVEGFYEPQWRVESFRVSYPERISSKGNLSFNSLEELVLNQFPAYLPRLKAEFTVTVEPPFNWVSAELLIRRPDGASTRTATSIVDAYDGRSDGTFVIEPSDAMEGEYVFELYVNDKLCIKHLLKVSIPDKAPDRG